MLYYGILVFFLIEYLRPGDFFPLFKLLHINAIIPPALLLGTLVSNGPNKLIMVRQNPNFKWMVFYTSLFILSLFTARLTWDAYLTLLNVIGYVLLFFLICLNIDEIRKIRGLFKTLIGIHVFVIASNVATFFDYSQRKYLSAGYFLSDGNDFSFSVCIVIPMCIYMVITSQSKFWKIIYIGCLIFLINSVVLTQSRGGTLALLVSMGYLSIKSKKKILSFGILAIGIICIIFFASEQYKGRMETIVEYQGESSAETRIKAWTAAVHMAVDHPLTGVGAGGFPSAYGTVYRPSGALPGEMTWRNTHSIFFKILAELGLPGFIALIGIIFNNLILNKKYALGGAPGETSPGETKSDDLIFIYLNASILGFAVAGAFLSGIYYPHLYVVMGVTAAAQILRARSGASLSNSPYGEVNDLKSS